jgi:uncharacterized protein YjbI with pentapeptide repeats
LGGAFLQGANLCGTNLGGANLGGANLRGANLWKAILREAYLWRADLRETNLDEVKSFFKAKLDTEVLSRIKVDWPEKLATVWDATAKNWILDEALLEQIKKPGWFGWPEEEGQGRLTISRLKPAGTNEFLIFAQSF